MMVMVTKEHLKSVVDSAKTKTREALQELFNEINKGQQKQIVKRENIKALFDLYGVEYEE